MQTAVHHAISSMQQRYYEPLTFNELAAEVFVSPFHFSRVFAKTTGITPGRYLTAIRLFEAKRRLAETRETVADVVCGVGYSSVGTFTSRFSQAVGMTPTQYREPLVRDLLIAFGPHYKRLPSIESLRNSGYTCARSEQGGGSISGSVELPHDGTPAKVLIGAFSDAVPQRGPVAYTGFARAEAVNMFSMENVPTGRWYVVAVGEQQGVEKDPRYFIGWLDHPIEVRPGDNNYLRLKMRTPAMTDPPFAFTLAPQRDYLIAA